MAKLPTTEQLNNSTQPLNPATTLAVNFVICQGLPTNHLQQINIPDGNSQYSSVKSHFILIPTNTFNYSIDFLPDCEYQLSYQCHQYPMCATSDSRTTKCSHFPRYTIRKSILHFWIFNRNANPKGRNTHLPYHL